MGFVGAAGPVTIENGLELGSEQLLSVISYLQSMSATQNVVQALKHTHSLLLWFSGQCALETILVDRCSV